MTSALYPYVATLTTSDPYLPVRPLDLARMSRDVSDAFVAISGGHQVVGQISFYPLQRTVPYHLLCDGKEVAKLSFPELFDYLGTSQGAAVDAVNNFLIPNYIGAASLVPAPTAPPETVVDGTVSSPGTGDTKGDGDSGGRRRTTGPIP